MAGSINSTVEYFFKVVWNVADAACINRIYNRFLPTLNLSTFVSIAKKGLHAD